MTNIFSMQDYSTKRVSAELTDEIIDALKNIRGWGSVEITVQDFRVVQITERNIKKTNERSMQNRQIKEALL